MAYSAKIKGLLGGAALSVMLLPALSGSASACDITTFASNGCFTSPATVFQSATGTNTPVTTVTSSSAPLFTITFNGATGLINYVSLVFKAVAFGTPAVNSQPFSLFAAGQDSINSNITFTPINGVASAGIGVPVFVTFFSSVGIQAGGNLQLQGVGTSGPLYAEISSVTVNAPAPIPGAGFLSFLAMGFAGMMRRGRSMMARLRGGVLKAA